MSRELVDAFWYSLLVSLAARLRQRHAAVGIDDYRRALELHYHGLGGRLSRRIVADGGVRSTTSTTDAGKELPAWQDREQVHLPATIARYPTPALNRELYFWLAAFLALDRPLEGEQHLPSGVRHLLHGVATSARVLAVFPDLAPRYRRLCAAELEHRQNALPALGSAPQRRVHQLEAAIRCTLADPQQCAQQVDDEWLRAALAQAPSGVVSTPGRHARLVPVPFLPVPLWGHAVRAFPAWRLRWLRRKTRRRAQGQQKSLTTPQFDTHIQAQTKSGRSLSGDCVYPEWDYCRRAYREDWCRVTEQPLPMAKLTELNTVSLARRVRRQFEALRQVRGWQRHLDAGEELDIDAYVDQAGDDRGCGQRSSRIYRARIHRWRDLAVVVLVDTSRSTAAWVEQHRVVDIARESMAVLAEALSASGDQFALYSFSSDSRLRVRCNRVKGFDERYDADTRRRLLALTAADYTRMGAAIRHVGAQLKQRRAAQRLLLVLSDGRPNDPTDGYQGDYALEDTRRALLELRTNGVHCFGLTIDQHARVYLPRLFGPGHYAVFANPLALPRVLPGLYARITALGA